MSIPGQFRLARLQVYNWGTFSKLHTVQVAREGFLITGPSGSGKSTLIDALSTILVPPAKVRFNAAASESGKSSGRDLITYCRGAWRREHATDVDELTRSFLRPGATWSGVNLTYEDGQGGVVSALRLMYLNANAHANQDIVNLFVVFPRQVEMQEFETLAQQGLNLGETKKRFPDAINIQRSHAPFINALRKQLGIADMGALDLLHRTQSAKSLGDLNTLMRSFMLPEPESFAIAEAAVSNFTDLQTAHSTVITAREQIAHLRPMRESIKQIAALNAEQEELVRQRDGLPGFFAARRAELAAKKLANARAEIEITQLKATQIEATIAQLEAEHERVLTAIHGREGAGIQQARYVRDDAQNFLVATQQRADDYSQRLSILGAQLPTTAEDFGHLRAQLRTELTEIQGNIEKDSASRDELVAEITTRRVTEREIEVELKAISKHRSAMDARLLRAREMICEVAQVHAKELPFVADVMHIDPQHERWQAAAERVMGGFARTLLVPEEHYVAVSTAIDSQHLGVKLAYERFTPELEHSSPQTFVPGSLGTKVQVRPGRFHNWVQSQLATRFDHDCAENLEQFRAARKAVTIQGQIKRGNHHIKDDRSAIDDRSRWVLSGNHDDKLAQLTQQVTALRKEIDGLTKKRQALEARVEQNRHRVTTVERLLETEDFALLDTVAAGEALTRAQAELDRLTSGDTQLQQWRKKESQIKAQLEAKDKERQDVHKEIGKEEAKQQQAHNELERAQEILAQAPENPEVADALTHRCLVADRGIRNDNVVDLQRVLGQELNDEITSCVTKSNRLASGVHSAMDKYVTTWPQRRGDLHPEQGWEGDFMAELDRLESDDLPRFEANFRDLLQEQTSTHLGRLRRTLSEATAKTRASISPINESLATVDFYPGVHLRIEVREAQPAVAREFITKLNDALAGSLASSSLTADEARFEKLKTIIDDLSPGDATANRERTLRLDTRQHVKFQGVEVNAEGNPGQVYDSSTGLSGGQAQKLSSFCLAAALRYRLTGMGASTAQQKKSTVFVDGHAYPKYGSVVLDEAFDRADAEFTRASMEAFRSFGFHMILATPEKLLQTVEDYIGGVLMVECPDRKTSMTSSLVFEEEGSEVSD